MQKFVSCRNVSMSYGGGQSALSGLCFDIGKGENIGLIGPIGSGKTTLIRCLAGVLRISCGIMECCVSREKIGYMPSAGGLLNCLSARENLEIWFRARYVPEDDRKYLAETLGIEKILEREAGLLSSGMKKAVLFACAVAGHPPFVLLDEPFVHLDIERCMCIQKVIREYLKESTVVVSSHNLEYLEEITDRLLILRNGRKIELASGQDLREKYGADAHDELGKLYLRIAADEEGRNSKKGGERQ